MNNDIFNCEELFTLFENIKEGNDCDKDKLHFYVNNESGSDIAEVYYVKTEKFWSIIKDNFPMPRKRYSWNLPVKTFGQLEFYFSQTGIDLIRKKL